MIDFDISRDTVVKAYDHLKGMGLIESVPGKGYFVCHTGLPKKHRVFLLFNKLSAHKKIIYDAFSQTVRDQVAIDFFVYHNDFTLFKHYILSHLNSAYSHYVIIPHFENGGETAAEILNLIPKESLIILDKKIEGISGEYSAVYQDFAVDIFIALKEASPLLQKYKRLKIIFPSLSYHPSEILDGFQRFCTQFGFHHELIRDLNQGEIKKGDVFICLTDDDLVALIKNVKSQNLKIGDEIGIISYNETPLKEILLDGITIISTDFENLGRKAGEMVLKKQKQQIANPFHLIVRNSL